MEKKYDNYIAENASSLLNALNDWCEVNDKFINCNKSKIVYFIPLKHKL